MNLTDEEITAQATDDTVHRPHPIRCDEGRFVCLACGSVMDLRGNEEWLPWAWLLEHRSCGEDARKEQA